MGVEVVVEGLTKSFGRQAIWRDVTLTLPAGEVSVMLGPSGTGKSVFLNTLASVLGDYAVNAPMETFMETRNDRHPTDLAALRGARLVTVAAVDGRG